MSDKTLPNLTRNEWMALAREMSAWIPQPGAGDTTESSRLRAMLHSIGNGEPFGVTWEDVNLLRDQAEVESRGIDPEAEPRNWRAARSGWDDLADVIAAFLASGPDPDQT